MNCRQCADNLGKDEIEPECAGHGWPSVAGTKDGAGATDGTEDTDGCPISHWDTDTKMLLALYDRVCPWGELDYTAFKTAFNDLEIPVFKHRMMRRNLVAIHREIKKQQNEKSKSEQP